MWRALAFGLTLAVAGPAIAQSVVVSPAPDAVSVTVYREAGRSADSEIDRDFPDGYALVTETRRIRIPAGATTVRFEGVAGGIFAESAIVGGLPHGIRERNLDADLLSPRTLFDRALGRRVMLRRTNPATGRVSEEQGVIRSSRRGGQVLTTASGVEAVHCSGLPEAVVHDSVPDGLTAKPTLSIALDSPRAEDVTVTLSYLAGGFDWQANYVVTMRPDGKGADLFAWLTLVSSDVTSFVDAGTQVIAGDPNREHGRDYSSQFNDGGKDYRCWRVGPPDLGPPPAPPPPPPPMMASPVAVVDVEEMNEVVVTGSRIAQQEELGDFKLYRVPQPVTVAAQSQKQVALIDRPAVPMRVVYASRVRGADAGDAALTLRARNRASDGLGLPLPAGPVAVFQPVGRRDVLVGETSTRDKAVGEDVEFELEETNAVSVDTDSQAVGRGKDKVTLTVTNANPWPIAYEATFVSSAHRKYDFGRHRPFSRDGRRVWAATVPANGSATLQYTVVTRDD